MRHFIIGAIAAAIAFYGLTRFLPDLFTFSGQTQGLLVLVALIANSTGFPLALGGFPPDLTADTLVAAVVGSVVIGVVTGVVNAVVP